MERRIAAIFAADMVGSTRLMERDEADVLTRHKAHLAEAFEPAFAEHRGRVIKGTGDGLIGVFDSVVDAVQCAVEIQKTMVAREADSQDDRRIAYRIGVNLGDVIFDEGDVYGDGVNVAARLEGLAEPGGVVVSGTAYDMLKGQVVVGYRPLGAVEVKNVSTPVRAFQVVEAGDAPFAPVAGRQRFSKAMAGVVAAGFLVCIGIASIWWMNRPDFAPADPAKMAYRLPDTPTLAVSAFKNLRAEAENEYLGHSLTEALVVKLTGSPSLTVIQAPSTEIEGSQLIAEIAEQSSARFVLYGSYLKEGESLQVTARLADALDGRQMWAETFHRPGTSEAFFEIQDIITDSVAASVNIELSTSDLSDAYRIENATLQDILVSVEASDAFQQWSPVGNGIAMQLYQSLLNRHPDSPSANTVVAWAWWQQGMIGIAPPAEVFPKAAEFAARALELNPEFSGAHAVMAWIALPARQFEMAELHIDLHIKLSNGNPAPSMTGALLAVGRTEEAEKVARKVMREQPRHHDFVPRMLAISLMRQMKFEESETLLRGIIASDTRDTRLKVAAATDLVVLAKLMGAEDMYRKATSDLVTRAPNLTLKHVAAEIIDKSGEWAATYLGALKEAGLPEG